MKKVKILRLLGSGAESDRRILWSSVGRLESLCALVLVWPLVEKNHQFTKWTERVWTDERSRSFIWKRANSRNHAVILAMDGSGSGQVYNSNYVSRSVTWWSRIFTLIDHLYTGLDILKKESKDKKSSNAKN